MAIANSAWLLCIVRDCFVVPPRNDKEDNALRIGMDTGRAPKAPKAYEWKARAEGNAYIQLAVLSRQLAANHFYNYFNQYNLYNPYNFYNHSN